MARKGAGSSSEQVMTPSCQHAGKLSGFSRVPKRQLLKAKTQRHSFTSIKNTPTKRISRFTTTAKLLPRNYPMQSPDANPSPELASLTASKPSHFKA